MECSVFAQSICRNHKSTVDIDILNANFCYEKVGLSFLKGRALCADLSGRVCVHEGCLFMRDLIDLISSTTKNALMIGTKFDRKK